MKRVGMMCVVLRLALVDCLQKPERLKLYNFTVKT